jgi:hypothetical protein
MFGLIWLSDKYHFVLARRGEPNAHGSLPFGLQRVILGLMLGRCAYYVILLAVLRRPAMGVTELVLKILPRNRKDHVKSE